MSIPGAQPNSNWHLQKMEIKNIYWIYLQASNKHGENTFHCSHFDICSMTTAIILENWKDCHETLYRWPDIVNDPYIDRKINRPHIFSCEIHRIPCHHSIWSKTFWKIEHNLKRSHKLQFDDYLWKKQIFKHLHSSTQFGIANIVN